MDRRSWLVGLLLLPLTLALGDTNTPAGIAEAKKDAAPEAKKDAAPDETKEGESPAGDQAAEAKLEDPKSLFDDLLGREIKNPVLVQYDFSPDKELRVALQRRNELFISASGQNRQVDFTMLFDIIVTSKGVGKDGLAIVDLQIDRLQFSAANLPVIGNIFFDSNKETPKTLPMIAPLFSMLEGFADAKLAIKVKPSGEVIAVRVPRTLSDRMTKLAEVPGMGKVLSILLGTEAIQDMIQSVYPVFDTKPIKEGDEWNVALERRIGDFGKFKMDLGYRADRLREVGSLVPIRVFYEGEVNFRTRQGSGGSGANAVLRDPSLSGYAIFETKKGEVMEVAFTRSFLGSMKEGKQDIEVRVRESFTLRQGKLQDLKELPMSSPKLSELADFLPKPGGGKKSDDDEKDKKPNNPLGFDVDDDASSPVRKP